MTSETTVQSYSKNLDAPRQAKKILAMVLEGKSNPEIASVIGCDQSAIWHWRRRHSSEIEVAMERAAMEVQDYAIASKAERVATLDWLATAMKAELRDNGIAWVEETRYGSKRRISGAATELRMALRQAAEELDQLPRAGVTVNNQNVVIVKTVSGSDAELG